MQQIKPRAEGGGNGHVGFRSACCAYGASRDMG